jgi:hypothetical protein
VLEHNDRTMTPESLHRPLENELLCAFDIDFDQTRNIAKRQMVIQPFGPDGKNFDVRGAWIGSASKTAICRQGPREDEFALALDIGQSRVPNLHARKRPREH